MHSLTLGLGWVLLWIFVRRIWNQLRWHTNFANRKVVEGRRPQHMRQFHGWKPIKSNCIIMGQFTLYRAFRFYCLSAGGSFQAIKISQPCPYDLIQPISSFTRQGRWWVPAWCMSWAVQRQFGFVTSMTWGNVITVHAKKNGTSLRLHHVMGNAWAS